MDRHEADHSNGGGETRVELKNRASLHNWAGDEYFDQGKYDQAVEEYGKALSLDPRNAVASHSRGNAWYKKGEYERAIEDYTRSLTIDPTNTVACYNRGNTYYKKGDLEQAINDYSKVIGLNPGDLETHLNRAVAYRAKGEFGRAIGDYTQALKLDPDNAGIRRALDECIEAQREQAEQKRRLAEVNRPSTLKVNQVSANEVVVSYPSERTFACVFTAIGLLGEVKERNTGKQFIEGRIKYGVQAVKIRASLVERDPGKTNVLIQASSGDILKFGSKNATKRLIETLRNLDNPGYKPDRLGIHPVVQAGLFVGLFAILVFLLLLTVRYLLACRMSPGISA